MSFSLGALGSTLTPTNNAKQLIITTTSTTHVIHGHSSFIGLFFSYLYLSLVLSTLVFVSLLGSACQAFLCGRFVIHFRIHGLAFLTRPVVLLHFRFVSSCFGSNRTDRTAIESDRTSPPYLIRSRISTFCELFHVHSRTYDHTVPILPYFLHLLVVST